jgi:hypothetical protein
MSLVRHTAPAKVSRLWFIGCLPEGKQDRQRIKHPLPDICPSLTKVASCCFDESALLLAALLFNV